MSIRLSVRTHVRSRRATTPLAGCSSDRRDGRGARSTEARSQRARAYVAAAAGELKRHHLSGLPPSSPANDPSGPGSIELDVRIEKADGKVVQLQSRVEIDGSRRISDLHVSARGVGANSCLELACKPDGSCTASLESERSDLLLILIEEIGGRGDDRRGRHGAGPTYSAGSPVSAPEDENESGGQNENIESALLRLTGAPRPRRDTAR